MDKIATHHFLENTASASLAGHTSMRCSRCRLHLHCFGRELPGELLHQLEQHIQTRSIPRGTQVYREGADFNNLYFVREGAFKNLLRNTEGDEFIVGFSLCGDVMGLEGCAEGYHHGRAVSLQDSEICELPYDELLALAADHPSLRNLLQLMTGRALANAQQDRLLLGRYSAEARLWAFLKKISQQLGASDTTSNHFDLPMTREDIAGFLGLQMETVSRAFHKLQSAGLINVQRRRIRMDMRPTS